MLHLHFWLFYLDLIGSASDLPQVKKPAKIPCEVPGTGLNKKVFFVCTERKLTVLAYMPYEPAREIMKNLNVRGEEL